MPQNFAELQKGIIRCLHCRDLFGFEPNPIQWGNESARIMIIGQAPSNRGHISTKPFNDQTGKKLRIWLGVDDETFYNRDIFYITAMGHCFPGKSSNGGDKKPPKICAEMWLTNEIKIVQTEVYFVLGRMASEFLFPKISYVDAIFKPQKINGKPAFVLPHPSPLNIKWFKDNPRFEIEKLPEIKEIVTKILSSSSSS